MGAPDVRQVPPSAHRTMPGVDAAARGPCLQSGAAVAELPREAEERRGQGERPGQLASMVSDALRPSSRPTAALRLS